MGCLAKFLLTVLALFGFSLLGWIVIFPGNDIFWIAFLVILAMGLIDLLLLGVKFLIELAALPLSCLTAGWVGWIIEGVFKYASLYLASLWIAKLSVPWILSSAWWEAILIGFAFAFISFLCKSKSNSNQRRRYSN